MQIGDKVQVLGTVRDIVDESVLLVTEDSMHQREYWFLAKHVTVVLPAPPVEEVVKPDHSLPEAGEGEAEPSHPIASPGEPVHPPPTPAHPIVTPPATPAADPRRRR